MKNNKRMEPEARSNQIIDAALQMASTDGWNSLTRDGVAKAAGLSNAMINFRFSTFAQLKRSVMREAIKREILHVIAQGYVAGDPTALKISNELKIRALSSL